MLSPLQICGWLWTIWGLVWLIWALQSKKTAQRESPVSRFSYILLIWAGLYLAFFTRRLDGPWTHQSLPYHPWLGWLGIAITAAGLAFAVRARAFLGSNWSGDVTIKVGHELIRTGPYRLVRHPIYTGVLLAFLGTALAHDQLRDLVGLVLIWLAFTIKRLKEERFMRQTFGSQYDDYARSTGAIFPLPLRRSS
jgi:protein-S-isoprenylcysteine O-methyltransferase Ste14